VISRIGSITIDSDDCLFIKFLVNNGITAAAPLGSYDQKNIKVSRPTVFKPYVL
jgi:hypothetical protein